MEKQEFESYKKAGKIAGEVRENVRKKNWIGNTKKGGSEYPFHLPPHFNFSDITYELLNYSTRTKSPLLNPPPLLIIHWEALPLPMLLFTTPIVPILVSIAPRERPVSSLV